VCNHCHRYEEELPKEFSGEVANQKLTQIINEIKESGKKKKEYGIIGVSGEWTAPMLHISQRVGIKSTCNSF
jgi:hypothetical protein